MNQKIRDIAEAVKTAVQEFDPTAEVTLFGSQARGDARKDSDYDFLVLFNLPIDYHFKSKVLDKIYEVELQTDEVISPLIHNKQEWLQMAAFPIFEEVLIDGISV